MSNLSLSEIAGLFPEITDIKPVKQGGQKLVYKGLHNIHGQVMIKILIDITGAPRLEREIQAVKLLNSKSVPFIYEHGIKNVNNEDYYYIIEEQIDGTDLRTLLQQKRPFTLAEIVDLLDTLIFLCVEMEKKGIVHRDINPNNIIYDKSGKYWLIDFGLTRHLALVSVTDSRQQIGPCTPGYCPPEQYRNIKKDIDSRTDLFCIGITTYEIINGVNPYTNGSVNANIFDIIHKTETILLPYLSIKGDTQNQLAGFLKIISDKHLSRRPKNAQEAYGWFKALLPTLVFN